VTFLSLRPPCNRSEPVDHVLHVLGLTGVVIKQEWKALPYFALTFAFAVGGIRLGALINARIAAGEKPVMNRSVGLLAVLGLAAFAG